MTLLHPIRLSSPPGLQPAGIHREACVAPVSGSLEGGSSVRTGDGEVSLRLPFPRVAYANLVRPQIGSPEMLRYIFGVAQQSLHSDLGSLALVFPSLFPKCHTSCQSMLPLLPWLRPKLKLET